ncbi:N-acetyllactosaminide beta-1,3-N-acetylglucosaminyltransferase 3-like [Erpetoichthys calabaricus]|uniref:N-acetyllactosaminide beta-1,3-N-acetylglucosaminyltransferase 3-like n=1 Tax=Erpetoichthys calabaricus TaxID=27687 RepID=UPI002233FD0B|nr:N-acetyllactosaminide beta-1,3-N-acetylglucosaminyltransferase 3-like [Erpetoichthys calabaricus]XP_028647481.2 N-acetyllactosaminide beta-1,3-N-acetylglucosaminyltransferase 3-like [Erpetoichthys calabaricus]XP_028647483.2 N-acetyllactosaminide beta-1,3-N-acetylglucosaminyltransferase 3-like [Erpetoichthys calabaricus]
MNKSKTMRHFLKFMICLLISILLGIFLYCCVDNKYIIIKKNLSSAIPIQRDSQILNDGKYVYLLDFEKYREEFPHLQDYKCKMISEPKQLCGRTKSSMTLILAIKSHPDSFDRRHALRQTWAQPQVIDNFHIKPTFLMATIENKTKMAMVEIEVSQYQDILQWDFTESHTNLSLKEYCFLEWMMYNCVVEFVFKGDDDEFVYPPAIVKYLKRTPDVTSYIHGNLRVHTEVLRGGKYKISHHLYSMNVLPTFVSGAGFIIPGILIPPLYRAATVLPVFPLDDVYFGFLAIKANVTLKHGHGFYCWGVRFDACKYQNALIIHSVIENDVNGMSPKTLLDVWGKVIKQKNCIEV